MYIFYLYVQTVTCQCFCFPNSQCGATAHDILPQREDRKLDILENISFLSVKQKHAMERRCQYLHKVFTLSSRIRVRSEADGVSESGIKLRTSS